MAVEGYALEVMEEEERAPRSKRGWWASSRWSHVWQGRSKCGWDSAPLNELGEDVTWANPLEFYLGWMRNMGELVEALPARVMFMDLRS